MPGLEVRALVDRLVRDDRERAEHDRGHPERAHRELVPRQARGLGLCLGGGLQREDACRARACRQSSDVAFDAAKNEEGETNRM